MTVAAACCLPGCEDEKPTGTSASASVAVDLSPVPAPASHLADVFVANPETTWKELRGLAGPGAALLPSSYPVLVTTLTGLSATASSLVDAGVPAVGVVVDAGAGRPAVVLGVHVRSGRELIAAATRGADARFDAKLDGDSQITELVPKNPGKGEPLGLGVLGNFLLVSTGRPPLLEGGPYVVRTLSKQPPPKEPIVLVAPQQALAGTVAKRIREAWKTRRDQLQAADLEARKQRGGRAPDFGDPTAALLGIEGAVDDLVAILEGSDNARLVIRPGARHLEAELVVTPKPAGEAKTLIDELATGPLTRLSALPRDTSLALLSQSTAAGRLESAKATEATFAKLLDKRLVEQDKKRLEDVLGAIAKGRGNQLVLALGRATGQQGEEVALLLQADVADAAELNRGIKGVRGLLEVPAFAEPLGQFIGGVKTQLGKGKAEGVTPAPDRIGFEIKPKAQPPGGPAGQLKLEPKRFEFLWRIAEGLDAAAAKDAGASLSALVRTSKETSLAAHPEFAAQAERAKLEVSLAVMLQPGRLGRGGSAPGADSPVLVTLGRRGGLGVVRFDVDQGALQSLARLSLR